MDTAAELSSALYRLPAPARAALAVELIDSLSAADTSDEELARLVEERDGELETGKVKPLSYEEFLAGLRHSTRDA